MGGNIVWNMEDSLLSGSEIGVVEKKLSCEKANFHILMAMLTKANWWHGQLLGLSFATF